LRQMEKDKKHSVMLVCVMVLFDYMYERKLPKVTVDFDIM